MAQKKKITGLKVDGKMRTHFFESTKCAILLKNLTVDKCLACLDDNFTAQKIGRAPRESAVLGRTSRS